MLASPVIARDKPLNAVADLRYGVALYNYYLDDYMSAMTELMVAEEQRAISGHGDNPEIMEGGLALGYGMERKASDIFERLLEENRSGDVNDAAWLFLAQTRYRNSDWVRSERALEKISAKPAKALRKEISALRLNILLKLGTPEQVEELLEDSNIADSWLPYFYFNLGSAFAREKNYDKAVVYFNELAREEYKTEEFRSLYDKAMTAAGYSYLFQQNYGLAREQFSQVRLSSPLSNRALLGYGWASAEMGEYQEALKPWLHLSKGALVDENHQEAMIAVPYAYEQLGSEGLALRYYQKAETSFSEEIRKIDDVLASLKNEDLLAALEIQQQEQLDWMSLAEKTDMSPRLTYLIGLFSRNTFQGSVQDLQDLLAIRALMLDWQSKLDFYDIMLDEREFNRTEKAEFLKVSELEQRIAEMQKERTSLAQKIERIAGQKDFLALASDEETALIKRVTRSETNVDRLRDSDPFIDEYEESVRRYKGLLMWQASEAYSDRLWEAIKTLNKLDDVLKDVEQTNKRVDKLMVTAPDLAPYRGRMDTADASLAELIAAIDDAINRNELDLKQRVLAVLEEQRRRLSNYMAQSRLSVARLYDKALQQREEAEFERIKSEAEQQKLAPSVNELAPVPTLETPVEGAQ